MGFDVQTYHGYAPVQCTNVEDILFTPVLAGHWRQSELSDGTYDLDDLMDIVEVMQVKNENERRQREFEELNSRK